MCSFSASETTTDDATNRTTRLAFRAHGARPCRARMAEQARSCDGGPGRCARSAGVAPKLFRRFPELPEAIRIRDLFDAQLTSANIATEVGYLARALSRGFERPYGWA